MLFTKSKFILTLIVFFSIFSTQSYGTEKWQKIKGNASDVAVDEKGRLFVVSSKRKQVYNWNVLKQDWDAIIKAPGNISKIAATKDGRLYAIANSAIYRYKAKRWSRVGDFKNAFDLGAGVNGKIWAISRNKKIATWDGNRKRWLILKTAGTKIAGKKPLAIDVDKTGNPFVVFYDSSIAYYISSRKEWKVLPGKAIDVACSSSGYVYVIGTSGNIFWWNTHKQKWEKRLSKVKAPFKRLSVLPNNTPWAITAKGDIYHRVQSVFTDFRPSKHGFHFKNSFKFNATIKFKIGVLEKLVPKDYYTYRINEPYGLCGGMAFGALEYFKQNRKIPTQTSPPRQNDQLYDYLLDRLYVSFGEPTFDNLRKALIWWGSFEDRKNLLHIDTKNEMPKITRELSKKNPVQLILIYQTKMTGSPWDNHQVLAYGFEKDYSSIRIFIYDPNRPDRDDIVLTYSHKGNGNYALYQNGYSKPKQVFGLFPIFPKVK